MTLFRFCIDMNLHQHIEAFTVVFLGTSQISFLPFSLKTKMHRNLTVIEVTFKTYGEKGGKENTNSVVLG